MVEPFDECKDPLIYICQVEVLNTTETSMILPATVKLKLVKSARELAMALNEYVPSGKVMSMEARSVW
jgi:hypothetical protein